MSSWHTGRARNRARRALLAYASLPLRIDGPAVLARLADAYAAACAAHVRALRDATSQNGTTPDDYSRRRGTPHA